jgi:3',5'-cyclic AMP phosphodiesterase CpdA
MAKFSTFPNIKTTLSGHSHRHVVTQIAKTYTQVIVNLKIVATYKLSSCDIAK